MTPSTRTTVAFRRQFELPGFDETLPPGDYEIEAPLLHPGDLTRRGKRGSTVRLTLHPRASHPGLSRTLSVPLAELEIAVARDRLGGRALTDFRVEEMLADPMIRLVMQADGVAESDIRDLYAVRPKAAPCLVGHGAVPPAGNRDTQPQKPGPRSGSPRPGIGE